MGLLPSALVPEFTRLSILTLGGQKALKRWQRKIYNALTPIFRVRNRILPIAGLSTIVIARKPAAAPARREPASAPLAASA